ncbi:unnamed protein product [Closterium sp. Yama58-4]|nr:unnamed protein product [Closterium sp. Yama58-4]
MMANAISLTQPSLRPPAAGVVHPYRRIHDTDPSADQLWYYPPPGSPPQPPGYCTALNPSQSQAESTAIGAPHWPHVPRAHLSPGFSLPPQNPLLLNFPSLSLPTVAATTPALRLSCCVPHNPHPSSARASASSFSQNGASSYPPYQQPPYRHQQPSFPPPLSYPPPFPTPSPYPHTLPLPSHSFQPQAASAACPPGVAVFWDYENCPVPVGADCAALVRRLRDLARAFGAVRSVRAYGKPEEVHARMVGKMGACGVEVVAVAAGKEMADKAIITDALLFALDEREMNRRPSLSASLTSFFRPAPSLAFLHLLGTPAACRAVAPCVVVVSGDVGFAGVLAKLTNRGVTTVLLARPRKNGSKGKRGTIPAPLAQSAMVTLDWDQLIAAGDSGAAGENGWRSGKAGDDGGVC